MKSESISMIHQLNESQLPKDLTIASTNYKFEKGFFIHLLTKLLKATCCDFLSEPSNLLRNDWFPRDCWSLIPINDSLEKIHNEVSLFIHHFVHKRAAAKKLIQ